MTIMIVAMFVLACALIGLGHLTEDFTLWDAKQRWYASKVPSNSSQHINGKLVLTYKTFYLFGFLSAVAFLALLIARAVQ